MSIAHEIDKKLSETAKEGYAHRNFLKLIKSELTAEAVRKGKELTDEQERYILVKLQKANCDTAAALIKAGRQAEADILLEENEVLRTFLPPELTVEAMYAPLWEIKDKLRAAHTNGQAFGMAMAHLKKVFPGLIINTPSVGLVVDIIRVET
jgi:uncharacterized protein YqeY